MLIIYGTVISPYVRKVLMTLHLKNIEYRLHEVNPLNPEDKKQLLQLSPLGKIPILKKDDFLIPDSSVICAYLDKAYPHSPIIPADPHQYAKTLWWEEYSDTELTINILMLFTEILAKHNIKTPFNVAPDVIKNIREVKLPQIFDYLNQEILDKDYFVGNQFSLADISLLSALMSYALFYTIDGNRWKNLARYIETGFKVPAVNTVLQETKKKIAEKYSAG